MNASEIFDVIEEVAATASKTEKQALLEANSANDNFKRTLNAALNPFVTYGVKQLPEVTKDGFMEMGEPHWSTLDALAKRLLTGGAAQLAIQMALDDLNPKARELFKRILLKDMRAGFGESTANKAIPGVVPTFDCMLAHPYSAHKHKLSFPLFVEPKLDGVRVLTFVTANGGSVQFFSRSGKEYTTFDHLKAPVTIMVNAWLTMNKDAQNWWQQSGEGLVLESEVVSGSFNKTVGDVRRKSEQAVDARLCIFDLLPISVFSETTKSGSVAAGLWRNRRKRLESLCAYIKADDPLELLDAKRVVSEEEIIDLYNKFRARGLEGAIVKDPQGLYHRRRNWAWTKLKAEESVDVIITGAVEGTGKYEGMLGALIVDFNGVTVNVGSGLSDEQRREFWDAYMDDLSGRADTGTTYIGDLLGRMIEVEYHEVTPDGSLRHPRFIRFRDDKQPNPADAA